MGYNIWIPAKPDPIAQQRVQDAIVLDSNFDQGNHVNDQNGCTTNTAESSHQRQQDVKKYGDGVTCQVLLVIDDSEWMLQSYTLDGSPKTTGGDEFYVTYREGGPAPKSDDPRYQEGPTAIALVEDLNDGWYRLRWSTPPLHSHPAILDKPFQSTVNTADGSGDDSSAILTVHFEYTNGIGQLGPPAKNEWKNGAYTHLQYSATCPCRPPDIQNFTVPPALPDLSKFSSVVSFGDSTFDQLVQVRPHRKHKYKYRPNIVPFGDKICMPLNLSTVDQFIKVLAEQHGDVLKLASEIATSEGNDCSKTDETAVPIHDDERNATDSHKLANHSTALIFGSCLWDLLSSADRHDPTFDDHIDACRELVIRVREEYPNVALFWKLPTAVHIHWVELDRLVAGATASSNKTIHAQETGGKTTKEADTCTLQKPQVAPTLFGVDRVRYMSRSRSWMLYQRQAKAMQELNMSTLDFYLATHLSAYKLYPSDGRHYRAEFNKTLLGWCYGD